MAFLHIPVYPNSCSETLPKDFLTKHDMNIIILDSTKEKPHSVAVSYTEKEIRGIVHDMFISSYHVDRQLREVAEIEVETSTRSTSEEMDMLKGSCLYITDIERILEFNDHLKTSINHITIYGKFIHDIDCSLAIENNRLISALKRSFNAMKPIHKNKNLLDNTNILEDNTMENINNFNTTAVETPTPPATDDNEYRNNKIFSLPLICNEFSVRMAYEVISKKEINIKTVINNRDITGCIDDIDILNNIPMIRVEYSKKYFISNEEIEYIRNSYVTIEKIDICNGHIDVDAKFDRGLKKYIKDTELINVIKEKNRIKLYGQPEIAEIINKPEENESELLEVILCTYSKSLSKYQSDSIAEFALNKFKEDPTKIGYVTIINQKNARLKAYGDGPNNFLTTSTYKIEDYDSDNNSLKLKPIRVRSQSKPYIISVIGIIMHGEDIEFRCVEIIDENKRLVSEPVSCL